MATTETGHAKNAANFVALESICSGFGGVYNPSRASIRTDAMQNKITETTQAFSVLATARSAASLAIDEREAAYAPLGKLVTRVFNALKASDATAQNIETAKTLVNKLQGRRASAKLTDEEKKAREAEGKSTQENSSAQMSFDNRIDNLSSLIQLLIAIPSYAPNETELSTAALSTTLDNMKAKNTAVVQTSVQAANARIIRNEVLYNETTGVIALAGFVKAYVKSLFGSTSPQYKQISGLRFTQVK